MMAASRPMIASTQRISISPKPRAPATALMRAADDIGCRSTAAFLTVRTEGRDGVWGPLARRAIQIDASPGIVGHHATAQIWPVPARLVVAACQRAKPLVRGRIAAEVEVVEVE